MSRVYKCDRCGAIEPDDVNENTRFTQIGLRRNDLSVAWKDLCPHCMKKLEDFLSDPNCMENLEEDPKDMGEVSDGYHTFNQLYHQRAVLFAALVKQNKDKAWKSFKHSDGEFCFGEDSEMFIVGIDTPEGSYTYHYHKKYWDMFDCRELVVGKEWDGHTEEDVTRLLSLPCDTKEDMNKEVSELSVECHTNAAGVTVPDSQPFVDKVAAAVSDNPDDPCPCYAKKCAHPESCCGCKEYDKWKERQKK